MSTDSVGVGVILFACVRLAVANPEQPDAAPVCLFSTPEQARLLADRLLEQGSYSRAGECYRVAGDYARANSASIKATRVATAESKSQLTRGRDESKAQWQRLKAALQRKR